MKRIGVLALLILLGLVGVAQATATLTAFCVVKDRTGNSATLVPNACTYVTNEVLAANTAETITVPAGANYVSFSSTGNFYVNFTTTATVPSGDITDGTGSILNPGIRFVGVVQSQNVAGVSSFSIIAPADCIVSFEWYR